MLKIKLLPTGKRNQPHFRIVVAPDRSKLTGAPAAVLGHYHPLSGELEVDQAAVKEWLSKGAQPTLRVRRLLKI